MKLGFCSIKDILDVIIVPSALLAITLLWPWFQKERMKKTFLKLIKRELTELNPEEENLVSDSDSNSKAKWCDHLRKKFMHEAIFSDPSNNRDFILSINDDLAYYGIQMWMHFHKAEESKSEEKELINYHGKRWLDYLEGFCQKLPRWVISRKKRHQLCKEWKKIVEHYEIRSRLVTDVENLKLY